MGYPDYLKGLAPPWLRSPEADAWWDALGQQLDQALAKTKSGVRVRVPAQAVTGEPSADALAAIGGERMLERSVSDTDPTYLARLAGAWNAWALAGTANGLLQALYDLGYRQAYLPILNGFAYHLDGSRNLVVTTLGGPWRAGSAGRAWAKINILFLVPPAPGNGAPSDWSAALPAAGSVELEAIKRIIVRWKPGHVLVRRIIVRANDKAWGLPLPPSERHWGDAALTWGGGDSSFIQLDL